MPFLAWALNNWKAVFLFALISAVAGYIWYLRADVMRHEKSELALRQDIETLKADLGTAKTAIGSLKDGLSQTQAFVNSALESVKAVQARIGRENKALQARLDNIVVAAREARRIEDAPAVQFFTDLVGIDNGVYRYRVRPSPD